MADQHVVEIVTYRPKDGVTDAEIVQLTKASQAYIETCGGYLSRSLSRGEDGNWTDRTLWSDMASAKSAQDGFMAHPDGQALAGAIVFESMEMRHEPLVWQS